MIAIILILILLLISFVQGASETNIFFKKVNEIRLRGKIPCFVSASLMLGTIYDKHKQNWVKNKNIAFNKKLCSCKIMIYTQDTNVDNLRQKFVAKYKPTTPNMESLVFGDASRLKLFVHAFNVAIINNIYYIAYSWSDLMEYDIKFKLNENDFNIFITKVLRAAADCDIVKLLRLFKYTLPLTDYVNLKTFVLSEKLKINDFYTLNCIDRFNSENRKKYAIIGNNGLDHSNLILTLKNAGFQDIAGDIWFRPGVPNKKYTEKKPLIDLLFQEQTPWYNDGKFGLAYTKGAYKLTSRLCSLIDNHSIKNITDKVLLYDNIRKHFPDLIKKGHLAKSETFNSNPKSIKALDKININEHNPVLVKPEGKNSGWGRGIKICTNKNDVINNLKNESFEKYIVSEYLIDLMTIRAYENRPEAYKFHFRSYMLLFPRWQNSQIGYKTKEPYSVEWSLFENSEILTSELPFVLKNYDNVQIHDTHGKSTHRLNVFPRDSHLICSVPENNAPPVEEFNAKVFKQMNNICATLVEIIKKSVRPYAETIDGYGVVGIDFMIRKGPECRVVIIETNYPSGYTSIEARPSDPPNEIQKIKKTYSMMSTSFFDQIFSKVIDPYFINAEPTQPGIIRI